MVLTIAISLQPLENPPKKIWHWKIWNISHLLANRYSHWKTPEKNNEKIGTSAWRWRSEARLRRKRRAALEVGRRSEVSVSWRKKLISVLKKSKKPGKIWKIL